MNLTPGIELELVEEASKSPELQLWSSVIQLAIMDAEPYIKGWVRVTYDQARHGKVALNWLCSENTLPGSFRWACYLIGIDRHRVRKMIGVKEQKIW